MTNISTDNLDGIALDYAVALIEAPESLKYGVDDWRGVRKHGRCEFSNGEYAYRWHQSWAQAGTIIEREGITIEYRGVENGVGSWESTTVRSNHVGEGKTPLVAAMRAYVLCNLGISVEIPDELFI